MIDITDFTFLIPIRMDSIVRVENLMMTIDYIRKNFRTHIIVLQAAAYEDGFLPNLLRRKANYIFAEDRDNVFYRTKYLNLMTQKVLTPYQGIWDTDVIIPKEQIFESVKRLREGYDVVYPYDGHFYDTSDIIREQYFRHRDVRILQRNMPKMGLIYGTNMKGGAMFVNRMSYINAGMENEGFYGWGPEDWERYERWKTLGLKVVSVKGGLFHLSHGRGSDSHYRSQMQMLQSNKEYMNTLWADESEIKKTISLNRE